MTTKNERNVKHSFIKQQKANMLPYADKMVKKIPVLFVMVSHDNI